MYAPPAKLNEVTRLVKIAREIAMDIYPIEQVMATFGVSEEEWSRLRDNPHFNRLVQSEVEAWNAAGNSKERVQVKSSAIIEDWLLEASARLHDPKENLTAKTELAKLVSRLADMGVTNVNQNGGGEKFSLTINIGDGREVRVAHDITPQVTALPVE